MKLTNKQAILLHSIVLETLKISDESKIFSLGLNTRNALISEILEQQDGFVEVIKKTRYQQISKKDKKKKDENN